MDTMDLNEDNYDYDALLSLFSLTPEFTLLDLKGAKRKVLKLHPDKCSLPDQYYHFFRKMYLKVEEIYHFTHHTTEEEELKKDVDIHTHFKDYLERNHIDPKTNFEKFSKEFNKMFDHVFVNESDSGYGDWLKSKDNYHDKDDLESSRTQVLGNQIVPTSSSIEGVDINIKQNLQTYDVKESHGTPFIAMDVNEVMKNKKQFRSVQELQAYQAREENEHPPTGIEQSQNFLQQKESMLNHQSKQIAYEHLRKKEATEKKYKSYISNYLSLES
tara:strand:+ start:51 stop:866 length:816 start_codon:yes stop_codon:yes gene_type:complete